MSSEKRVINFARHLRHLNELLGDPRVDINQVVDEVFSLEGISDEDRLAVEANLAGENAQRAMELAKFGVHIGIITNNPGILYFAGYMRWAAQTQGEAGAQLIMDSTSQPNDLIFSSEAQQDGTIIDLGAVLNLLEILNRPDYFESANRVSRRLQARENSIRRSVIVEKGLEARGPEMAYLLGTLSRTLVPVIENPDFFYSQFLRANISSSLVGMQGAVADSDRSATIFGLLDIVRDVGNFREGKRELGDIFIAPFLRFIDG